MQYMRCVVAELAGESSDSCSFVEVETGFDIYLAPDCGPQTDGYYSVRSLSDSA